MAGTETVFHPIGPVSLRVSLAAGDVRIEADAGDTVTVALVPLRDNDHTRELIEEARVELLDRGAAHELVVQIPKRSGFRIAREGKVGVRITCPEGSDLDLRSTSADLEATGSLGAVVFKTQSGSGSLEDAQSLQADSGSGDLVVRDVVGSCDLRTASGDVTVGRCGGRLAAKLVSGSLDVAEAAGGLAATTVSGDVRVDAAGGGAMRVQSVSGDVSIGIRPGERLFVDASSVSGTMSSELGLGDVPPPAAAGPVHELRVRTVSGDCRIRRAVPVGA